VDHGRESISFIRLGEIYSVDSFRDMTIAKKLYNKVPVYPMVFDSNEYLIKIKNQSTISADYEVIDLVNGQKQVLQVGVERNIKFELEPNEKPRIKAYFKSSKGQTKELNLPVIIIKKLQAPLNKIIKVDGSLQEWQEISGLTINKKNNVILFQENWQGSNDSSFSLKVASDSKRLFVAVEVSDDEINIIPGSLWVNDSIELYWNTKPDPKLDGKHGIGTGQVIVQIPKIGQKAELKWNIVNYEVPKDCRFEFKRTAKGYNCEMSFLLSELGFKNTPKSGDHINLEVMVDDLDIVDGIEQMSYMTISGQGNNYNNTTFYPRVFFK
jgi:hypothetical protein